MPFFVVLFKINYGVEIFKYYNRLPKYQQIWKETKKNFWKIKQAGNVKQQIRKNEERISKEDRIEEIMWLEHKE